VSKNGASLQPLMQRLSRFRPGRPSRPVIVAFIAAVALLVGVFFAGSASAQPPTPAPPTPSPSTSAQPTTPAAPSGSPTSTAPSTQAQPPGNPAPGAPAGNDHVSPPLPNNAQILAASPSVVNLVITASVDIDKLPAGLEDSGLPPGFIRGAHYHADAWSLCSAFFVGETTGPNNGYLSTNGHCLDPNEYVDVLYMQLKRPQPGTGKDDPSTTPQDPSAPTDLSDPGASKAKPPLTSLDLVDLKSKIKLRVQVVRSYDQPTTAPQNGSPSPNHVVDAKVIDYTDMDKGDYGLIKIDGLPYSPSIPVVTDEPQPGDNVIALGYSGNLSIAALLPNLSDEELNSDKDPYFAKPGKLASDLSNVRLRPTYTNGVLSFTNFPMDNGESAYYGANAAVTPGMSGGLAGMVVNGRIAAYGGISFTTALQPINFSSYGLSGYLSKNGVKLDGASAPGGNAKQDNDANSGSGDGKMGAPSSAPTDPPASNKVVPTAQGSDLTSPSVTIPLWIIAIAIALATLAWLYRALFGDFRKPRPQATDTRTEVKTREPAAVAAHIGDDPTVVHDDQPLADRPIDPDGRHHPEH